MSFSSGTFSINSTGQPVVTGTTISSTVFNAFTADIATGLSTCMLKDGTQTLTANIPFGGFKITGLGAGTATGNSIRYEQLFPAYNETKTTVASAASPDIWTSVGNVVDYTGTVTATGFATAPQSGSRRTLLCAGAAPFTAGANMLIEGYASGSTFTATAGDQVDVLAVTTTQFRLTMRPQSGLPVVGTSLPRSYLAGLTLSTAGGSGTMSIAAGQATDSTNTAIMALSAISKTTSSWAVGSGNGGLDTGSIANTTWYKFYEILRPDTQAVDVTFTTAALATGPAMPANYTKFRYIGSGLTDGAAHWVAFIQDGDYFRWSASVLDVNATNPGTSAVTQALASVPTGINVFALINVYSFDTTPAGFSVVVSDLAAADEAPSTTAAPIMNFRGLNITGGDGDAQQMTIRTNTSAQIRYRLSASTANTAFKIATIGWLDRRGRDA